MVDGVDLSDSVFSVKQSLIRNKYEVRDSNANLVLKAKQKMFKMKEEFTFKNPEGETVLRVKAQNLMDVAGNYLLTDDRSGEELAILEKKFTFFKHVWKIRDPEDESLRAKVESDSLLVEILRNFSEIFSLIPHSYIITDSNSNEIGRIKGHFSLHDRYNIDIDKDVEGREAVVAAAIAIDALEGN